MADSQVSCLIATDNLDLASSQVKHWDVQEGILLTDILERLIVQHSSDLAISGRDIELNVSDRSIVEIPEEFELWLA